VLFNDSLTSASTSSTELQCFIDYNNDITALSENYDIANYIDYIHTINDFTKFMIFKHHWVLTPG